MDVDAFGILYILGSDDSLVCVYDIPFSSGWGTHTEDQQGAGREVIFLNADVSALNGKLRRIAHIIVFAVLTILLGMTLRVGMTSQVGEMPTGRLPMWFMIFPAVWSYADEATKPLIQGRHFSWFDVGLNLLGTVIGGLVVAVIVWVL